MHSCVFSCERMQVFSHYHMPVCVPVCVCVSVPVA